MMKVKNIIMLLLISCFLAGCSSDDEEIIIKITFQESELKSIDGVEGLYFFRKNIDNEFKADIAIYFPYTDDLENMEYACNAICPNNGITTHEDDIFIRLSDDDKYFCPQCGAKYDIKTGEPANSEADNYKLQVYKVGYNKNSKIYRVYTD